MKIMIDIPKEFESDFSVNRFSDCFNRCLLDLKEYSHFAGNYERETLVMLMEAFKNGTPLPKGHGRLIDADAFISALKDASKRHKYKELSIDDYLTVDDVFKAVIGSLQNRGLAEDDTPTIIEADKED